MTNEFLEAYYSKPLHFVKVRGFYPDGDLVKVEFFAWGGVKLVGSALIDVWQPQPLNKACESGSTWVFCRVMSMPIALTVKLQDKEGKITTLPVRLQILDTVPEEFVSTIGTKDGITYNNEEEAREFCEKQRACGFKPKDLRLVHVESSSLCNLRCQYCVVSNNYGRIERNNISEQVLDAALQSINEIPTIWVIQVSGLGEPLVNPGFCHMLWRIYHETKVRNIWFFSNGMLLTKEVSDELAKIPLNFKIFFSIDGRTPEENGRQRRGSVYPIVRQNILYFLKQIAGKSNFNVGIHNLIIAREGETVYTPEFLLNDFGFLHIDSHRTFYFPELSQKTLHDEGIEIHHKPDKRVCKRMFAQATIRSNGDVVRCHWDSACSIVMGNVLEQSLKEIWWSDKYVALRKKMMPEVPMEELPEACQKCHAMNDGYLYHA